jgi:hypothetical protein
MVHLSEIGSGSTSKSLQDWKLSLEKDSKKPVFWVAVAYPATCQRMELNNGPCKTNRSLL